MIREGELLGTSGTAPSCTLSVVFSYLSSYLCGYIYLKSLDIDADRSVFIHVPRICEKFTAQTISDGILFVIKKCLKQLDEKNVL